MTCKVEQTRIGFLVTRDGAPVPPQVYPPALLAFKSRTHARALARAIDSDDHPESDRLIAEHGQWWS